MNASLHRTKYDTVSVNYFKETSDNKAFTSLQVSDDEGNYITLFFYELQELQYFLSLAGIQADKLMKESARENLDKVKSLA